MEQCSSKEYQDRVKLGIATTAGGAGEVICCQQNGCNWNVTVHSSGQSIEEFLAGSEEAVQPRAQGLAGVTVPDLLHAVFCIVATQFWA